MKRNTVLALSLAAALLLTACGVQAGEKTAEEENAYHKITAEEAKTKIEEGNVTILDVRTEEEYQSSHIPGAMLLPLDKIGSEPPKELPDKEADILIYCRSGNRSKQAADRLVKLGYLNIYDFGGIMDWPYETEGEATP